MTYSNRLFFICVFISNLVCYSQNNTKPTSNPNYWQQQADYTMDIDMDVKTYQYKGTQTLVYTNNSPDILTKVFYHLYPNAFQPGSEMDARLQSIKDPDRRMVTNVGTKEDPIYQSRISQLKPNEIGYIKVNSLNQDGETVTYKTIGTILEVNLAKPIQPGEKTTFNMVFNAQVPVQIRRSGRNNKEGVALSMAQWYPKLAEYDDEGWHADPYIAREFYGVWGNFDVKITIDKHYMIGGTGYLQNPNEIGFGYETGKVTKPKGNTLTWHFIAPNVHDFTWAADPNFVHDTQQVPNGPLMHFIYKNDTPETAEGFKKLQPFAVKLMQYYSEHVGKYPYKQYSIIQGGDGGMEYAMCTLITGNRKFGSLVGTTAHEIAHTWFQFLLANNELKHEWMDEGFADYISDYALNVVMNKNEENPIAGAYKSYFKLVASGLEQPQTTHADRYNYNFAYSAYNKGAVFVSQLGYIIGEDNLNQTLKTYFNEWSFKHPKPEDFIKIAENVSGLQLDWYLTDWTKTTNTIDYSIKTVTENNNTTQITLERIGNMPMPLDIEVEYTDGSKQQFYIPLRMLFGSKPTPNTTIVLSDWAWAYPTHQFTINKPKSEIKSITIDPKELMADINRENNTLNVKDQI